MVSLSSREAAFVRRVAVWTCLVALLAFLGPTRSAAAGPCNGAALPPGFALTSTGQPYPLHPVPYGDARAYHPVVIATFLFKALEDSRNTGAQQVCLATLAGNALLAGSRLSTVPGTSPVSQARWYPYTFAFSANPKLAPLARGWISGFGQAAVLGALGSFADRTGLTKWTVAASQTFNSYLVPFSRGGFVTTDRGRTWFQEYPTSPPTYVLNGHQEATIALAGWYQRTGDARAYDLFQRGVAANAKALPVHSVSIPAGEASAYDGLRGWSSIPTRAATGSTLRLSSAAVVDAAGRVAQTLSLPVGRPPVARANLLMNPSFAAWSGGLPTSWSRNEKTIGSAVRPNGSGGLRILSSGRGQDSVTQSVPASKLIQGAWYRVSWRGRELLPAGKPGTSGRVTVGSRCVDGYHTLGGHSAVRGPAWATYDLLVRLPAARGCTLSVRLGQVDGTLAGTATDYDDVAVSLPQYAAGPNPRYPLVAIDDFPGHLRVTYTGTGEIQAWVAGRWWRVTGLASSVPRTVTVTVPERYTGVDIHMGYHENHVLELAVLYRLSGNQTLLNYARRWIPLAPSHNGLLDGITANPLPAPSSIRSASSVGTHHLLKFGPADSPALTWQPPMADITMSP